MPVVTLCTIRFNVQKPTLCTYVFCVRLGTNSDFALCRINRFLSVTRWSVFTARYRCIISLVDFFFFLPLQYPSKSVNIKRYTTALILVLCGCNWGRTIATFALV